MEEDIDLLTMEINHLAERLNRETDLANIVGLCRDIRHKAQDVEKIARELMVEVKHED